MSEKKDNLASFVSEMEILLRHIREHANLRGEIYRLDSACQLCKVYFADKLTIVSAMADGNTSEPCQMRRRS
ncbi:MAG TPA: hypothetical protein VGQ03_09895 [Nitrososphaera sp.]|nr:hypothetical protein [Nitrososphaera sp.]